MYISHSLFSIKLSEQSLAPTQYGLLQVKDSQFCGYVIPLPLFIFMAYKRHYLSTTNIFFFLGQWLTRCSSLNTSWSNFWLLFNHAEAHHFDINLKTIWSSCVDWMMPNTYKEFSQPSMKMKVVDADSINTGELKNKMVYSETRSQYKCLPSSFLV